MSIPLLFRIVIGSKVRFLNETGEGIVTAILSKQTAKVKIPSGFEIPYALHELVPMADPTKGKVNLEEMHPDIGHDPDPYRLERMSATSTNDNVRNKARQQQSEKYFEPKAKSKAEELPLKVDAKALANALNAKKGDATAVRSKGHAWGEVDIEVDLHAEELLEFPKKYSNGQILQTQMNHFVAALDRAHLQNAKRLIVIHGIGTGKLKSEIMQYLRENQYKRVQDASYAKYGFGATEIILR